MRIGARRSMICSTLLRTTCRQSNEILLPIGCFWRLIPPRRFTTASVHRRKGSSAGLPSAPARTRFAPSPTGFLHLGSLRTALFNYLLAKKTGGQFLLRLEDTDEQRTVAGAEERICEDLRWAGLQWDEGPQVGGPCGPYKQSERTELYQEHASKLIESGHAYRCFCSAERLDDLARRRQEVGLPTDYDRHCFGVSQNESDKRASAGEAHVIRLRAPQLYPTFTDLIYGRVGKDKGSNAGITQKYGETAYEDPILLKTDGRPTYHLANVVDDHFMDITHVIRATEWISSTPKHLALYDAFGWQPPAYAHVGLLVDESGHKLSKRTFDTNISSFRDNEVLPEALVNFVSLLGWSHGKRTDVMTLKHLVDEFQMKFTKGNTTVTLEKLWYLQRAHASIVAHEKSGSFHAMVDNVMLEVQAKGDQQLLSEVLEQRSLAEYVTLLIEADARNYTTAKEFVSRNGNFFQEPRWSSFQNPREDVATIEILHDSVARFLNDPLMSWDNFNQVDLHMKRAIEKGARETRESDGAESSRQHEKAFNLSFCKYLRWVLLGGEAGPALAASTFMLGRETCLRRLASCEAVVQGGRNEPQTTSMRHKLDGFGAFQIKQQ